MSTSFPVVLVKVDRANEGSDFFETAWQGANARIGSIFLRQGFGSIRREVMAKPIGLTDGPFTLKRVNVKAVALEASANEINHLDVFVWVGVKDVNAVDIKLDVMQNILGDFLFHGCLGPSSASQEAHWDSNATPLAKGSHNSDVAS
jgi:hypothetical protein